MNKAPFSNLMKPTYCPYCNKDHSLQFMTDEHVIPDCINGDRRTVIGACKKCNSRAGELLDPLLCKFNLLRIWGMVTGRMMNRFERHKSMGELIDRRLLEGFFYWEEIPGKFQVAFEPAKNQPDGSIWINKKALRGAKAPANVNIYSDEMLRQASFKFDQPSTAGLEPALLKVLLGGLYLLHGERTLRHKSFDPLRSSLSGQISSTVSVVWVKSLNELVERWKHKFLPVGESEHMIWGGSTDGQIFYGGVRLYTQVVAEVTISDFGRILDERVVRVAYKNPKIFERTPNDPNGWQLSQKSKK